MAGTNGQPASRGSAEAVDRLRRMQAFHVRGGRALSGTVHVSGAKNSALKVVAATLLTEGRSTIRNVPAISDMGTMAKVLEHLGVTVRVDEDAYTLDVPAEVGTSTPAALVQRLRASIVVLGPLLARHGRARVAQPGGCNLGSRGIDMHLAGLERLGAAITYGEDYVEARADRLVGADLELPYASVGATENLLMAAVTAEGTTHIGNAAREPEIADLAAFLSSMGAQISGAGTSDITITGVGRLAPADHVVVPDRIEAGTYAVAAALAGGEVKIDAVVPAHLRMPLSKLRALGVEVDEGDSHMVVRGPRRATGRARRLRSLDIVTLPFPGFPTDLQPQLLVLLSQSHGTSMLTENVFDGRFSIVGELRRMGADITLEGHHALVRGPVQLHGQTVRATDLRAGAALVLAGLVAEGETLVAEPEHVDRGYSDFAGRLRALGADVERVDLSA
jgi:UDP-N-acetylglucosamine 1-carboxyvinyltransferase